MKTNKEWNSHFTKVKMTHSENGKIFEVKTTNTGVIWGVFVDGEKYTDFMINERRPFREGIAATLVKLGATKHTFRT